MLLKKRHASRENPTAPEVERQPFVPGTQPWKHTKSHSQAGGWLMLTQAPDCTDACRPSLAHILGDGSVVGTPCYERCSSGISIPLAQPKLNVPEHDLGVNISAYEAETEHSVRQPSCRNPGNGGVGNFHNYHNPRENRR